MASIDTVAERLDEIRTLLANTVETVNVGELVEELRGHWETLRTRRRDPGLWDQNGALEGVEDARRALLNYAQGSGNQVASLRTAISRLRAAAYSLRNSPPPHIDVNFE